MHIIEHSGPTDHPPARGPVMRFDPLFDGNRRLAKKRFRMIADLFFASSASARALNHFSYGMAVALDMGGTFPKTPTLYRDLVGGEIEAEHDARRSWPHRPFLVERKG